MRNLADLSPNDLLERQWEMYLEEEVFPIYPEVANALRFYRMPIERKSDYWNIGEVLDAAISFCLFVLETRLDIDDPVSMQVELLKGWNDYRRKW